MVPITDHMPIIQADPALSDCNDEMDEDNWSSRMSFNRVKRGLRLFLRAESAMSGYDERVNGVE